MGTVADERHVTWMTSERTQQSGAQVVLKTEKAKPVTPRKPRAKASDGEH